MSTTYVVLFPDDEQQWESATSAHREAVYAKHSEFSEALSARGHKVTGGAELAHSRDTRQVTHVDGKLVVTDGPFAETVEQLTGFYVVESDDLDDMIRCVGILTESAKGVIEVREAVGGTQS